MHFKQFIQKNNLVDIWRKMYPKKMQFTWRQLSLNLYSRLDYWLISRHLCHLVTSTDIRPALKCDHNAISIKLKLSDEKRGKGFWKINNNLLCDDLYKENIVNIIKKVQVEQAHIKVQQRWELCKIRIKEFSISYAKEIHLKKKRNTILISKTSFVHCQKIWIIILVKKFNKKLTKLKTN